MPLKYYCYLPFLSFVLFSCKTSGDIASGRNQDEQSAIQNVENPALNGSNNLKDPKEISERLNMAEGELESIKASTSAEQEALKNKIAELEKQNLALQEELTKSKTPPPAPEASKENPKTVPAKKIDFEQLWQTALNQYKSLEVSDSAITFNQLIDKFPKRKESALAWFGQACSFVKLKQKDSAQLIFEELIKRYPKSLEASLARKILAKK